MHSHLVASAARVRSVLAYGALALTLESAQTADPPFTIVLVPDTQNYHEGSSGFQADHITSCITATPKQTTFACQMQWIVENTTSKNIRVAIHLGDITDANGESTVDAGKPWEEASDAYALLDKTGLPYSVVPGNHDHDRATIAGDEVLQRDVRYFEWFFPPSRYPAAWYVDSFPKVARANRNNAIRFEAGREKFAVISLDMAPEKDAVCWADSLARALPDHHLIVATHCYQGRGAPRADSTREGKHQRCALSYNIVGMDGIDLWNELLALHSNIALVVSGHIQGGVSYNQRASLASNEPVHEILVDYQEEKFDGRKHGAGWMRLIELDPEASRLRSKPLNVIGRTAFNAKSTSDVCDSAGEKPLCYQNDPLHKDHTFDTTFSVRRGPDKHVEPVQFTDRYVNEIAAGNQNQSRMAMLQSGDFVGIWRDDSEAPAEVYEIFARGFRRDGCARTGGYRVNQNSRGQQREPDIAVDASDRAVTVWADDSRGAVGKYQIYARGVFPDGRQRFFPRTVNQVATGDQRTPRVAVARDGRFFVAWHDTRTDAGDIYARGYTADATPLFNEVLINAGGTAGTQDSPDIAVADNGDFVVVWRSGNTIRVKSFKADGTPIGATQTAGSVAGAGRPAVAAAANGNAAVTWLHGPTSIRLRQFAIGATLSPNDVVVVSAPNGKVTSPAIDMTASGEFVVAWQDDSDDNDSWQIHMKSFLASGTAVGSAQTVNKNERGQQTEPSVAVAEVRNPPHRDIRWVVSWTDNLDKNPKSQIMARGGLFRVGIDGSPVP